MTKNDFKDLRGSLYSNYQLAKETTFKIGGCADLFFQPADLADLSMFLSSIPQDISIFYLGNGSNLLIPDEGIRGAVICLKNCLGAIQSIGKTTVRVEAGCLTASLLRYCANNRLTGLEYMAGIPATIGGALAMNAGVSGKTIWDYVKNVEMIDRSGNITKRNPEAFVRSYRSVIMPKEEWFVAAEFSLQLGDKAQIKDEIKARVRARIAKQPLGTANCGSVFRNPPNDVAGRLIEACALKGLRIGDAVVSKKHANFIENIDNATAHDVETLIQEIKKRVQEKFSIELEPEVKIADEYRR